MRNGILVEEDSPNDIIVKYNVESLETAFLKLCYDQDLNKVCRNQNLTYYMCIMKKNSRVLGQTFFIFGGPTINFIKKKNFIGVDSN